MRWVPHLILLAALGGCVGGSNSASGGSIDVSTEFCAGLVDGAGAEIVPRTSVDGCEGAFVRGSLHCQGCDFTADAAVSLSPVDWTGGASARCGSVPLSDDGTFTFGEVAPYGLYSLGFEGGITPGTQPSMEGTIFTVCSDRIMLSGMVLDDSEYETGA